MLQKPFDHGHGTLGLHSQHGLTESGRSRRSEKPGSLEPRFRVRQLLEDLVDARGEHRARAVQIAWSDGAPSGLLPPDEERFEHIMEQLALPPRIHDFLVVRLFIEAQHVLREELERTPEVRLERAHRPRAGFLRADTSVEFGRIGGRPLASACRPVVLIRSGQWRAGEHLVDRHARDGTLRLVSGHKHCR